MERYNCVLWQMAAMSPGLQSPLQSRGSKEFKAAVEAALHTPDSSPERSPGKPGCRGQEAGPDASAAAPCRSRPQVGADEQGLRQGEGGGGASQEVLLRPM